MEHSNQQQQKCTWDIHKMNHVMTIKQVSITDLQQRCTGNSVQSYQQMMLKQLDCSPYTKK